jgi:hypothetical protein
MMKFISGLVVGLLGGIFLTVLLPITPNLSNRYEVIETGVLPIAEEVQKRVITEKEHAETFYKEITRTLDEDTQEKWEKITTDPVWDKLTEKNKSDIWEAFEKTYISEREKNDDRA